MEDPFQVLKVLQAHYDVLLHPKPGGYELVLTRKRDGQDVYRVIGPSVRDVLRLAHARTLEGEKR